MGAGAREEQLHLGCGGALQAGFALTSALLPWCYNKRVLWQVLAWIKRSHFVGEFFMNSFSV